MTNERIRKLAKQAGLEGENGHYEYDFFDPQRFAELIIRECADIADQGYASDNFGNGVTGKQILNYFGVDL